ncbi:MAG: oligosaccharide flippase family protein [Waterburya sp.]
MASATIRKQAINGTVWTITGYGISQSLRLGSNLILTRLLVPELFGLMALVNVFLTGLALFSDIGIRPSIIQNKRGNEPVFLNTAWTIQIVRSFGVWLGCIAIAFPVAQFYEEPRLTWLLPVVGFNAIVMGFTSTSLATLSRHMEVAKLTMFEIVTQIISLAVMVIWSWFNPTIWALVAGNLVSAISKMILSHRLNSGQPNRFTWNKEVIREINTFGKWIMISTAMTFLASQSDRLLLGKLMTLEMLGVYAIAFTVSEIPRQIVMKVGASIIFPLVSRRADLPRQKLRLKIQKQRWRLLVLLALIVGAIVGFGDLLISKLYDERYLAATWMLPILGLGIWPTVLSETLGRCLNSLGKPQYAAWGSFYRFLFIVIGLPLGFNQLGIFGAVIVVALNDLPTYLTVTYGLWREKLLCLRQDLQATAVFLGMIIMMFIIRSLLGIDLPIINNTY